MVHKIVIYNRNSCCKDRADGATVKVGNTTCGTLKGAKDKYVVQCSEPVYGSDIKITTKANEYLNLAEVEVYGVALRYTKIRVNEVSITKPYGSYHGSLCIDNKFDNFCHGQKGATLKATFEESMVHKIVIYNRNSSCCKHRADGATVKIGNTTCGILQGAKDKYVVQCSEPVYGSDIKITTKVNEYL